MSMHNHRLALDFAVFDCGYGLYDWFDRDCKVWDEVKRLSECLKLTWGGNWKSIVDKPHLSLKLGFKSEKETCLWLLEIDEKQRYWHIEDRYERYFIGKNVEVL